jgi:molybdopterin molybdotransferase
MASAGKTTVSVSKMPAVAVISSGNEIVEPQFLPGESQIRNSNSWQLMAQVERAGAKGRYYGIARDDQDETFSMVCRAIEENDVVIITGGVSMGDFDFIPGVLEKAGVKLLFTRVAVQPGKPTTFGIHENAGIFGLPGNPVSVFMMFEMLVRPFISAMMNYNWRPFSSVLPLKEDFSRKASDRMAIIPVKMTGDGFVQSVEYHGSAHITALAGADGIITVPVGVKKLEKGTLLTLTQI